MREDIVVYAQFGVGAGNHAKMNWHVIDWLECVVDGSSGYGA